MEANITIQAHYSGSTQEEDRATVRLLFPIVVPSCVSPHGDNFGYAHTHSSFSFLFFSFFFFFFHPLLSFPSFSILGLCTTLYSKASGKKLAEKDVGALLEEKRVLFVDFLYSQTVYLILSRSGSEQPLAADTSARIEESIFSFYAIEPPYDLSLPLIIVKTSSFLINIMYSKYHDAASSVNRQLNGMYLSRILGILSGLSATRYVNKVRRQIEKFLKRVSVRTPLRMNAITKRFFLEIEQKDFFSKKMSIAEFLIPHLRSLKFDIQSEVRL